MCSGATGCSVLSFMADLLSQFRDAVERSPDRVAIVDGNGKETTFAELAARVDDLARAWAARGIGPGDRVLLAMRLDADLYAALAALWSLGATVVLPEPAMGLKGLRHAARVGGVAAFCSSGAYGLLQLILPAFWGLKHLRPKPRSGAMANTTAPSPDDIALISFTSGTSGAPKAIPRSHGFLEAQHEAIAPLLDSERDERDLVAFPVFVLINIASGRTSILPNWRMSRLAQLEPKTVADWIERQEATRALLPPSVCEKLVESGASKPLRQVFTGGGPVFPDIVAGLQTMGLSVTSVYGSTEAEPIAHLPADEVSGDDLKRMTDGEGLLVGQPVAEVTLRIVGDEIQVAGGHVNRGYLDPAHDVENKIREGDAIWHRTGDAGRLNADGRLWLLGRVGSEVRIADHMVYPFSVEVAVRGWDGVRACALVERSGVPCLVIEGDIANESDWRARAEGLGIPDVQILQKIPMDRRHASKVDRHALAKLVS